MVGPYHIRGSYHMGGGLIVFVGGLLFLGVGLTIFLVWFGFMAYQPLKVI